MEWTPEAINAEVARKHEAAEHHALVRQLRQAQHESRPTWWRRLRSHPGLADEQNEDERHAA